MSNCTHQTRWDYDSVAHRIRCGECGRLVTTDKATAMFNAARSVGSDIIAALEAENTRLKVELAQGPMCAWCGARILAEPQATCPERVIEHMLQCDKHPVSTLSARISELATKLVESEEENAGLVSLLGAEKATTKRLEGELRRVERLYQAVAAERDGLQAERNNMRPAVRVFAVLMEDRLRANDHKGGWKDCEPAYLLSRIEDERRELLRAVGGSGDVRQEAADVANFAMMVADVYGLLPRSDAETTP